MKEFLMERLPSDDLLERSDGASGFMGVTRSSNGKASYNVIVDGQKIRSGQFESCLEAARARHALMKKGKPEQKSEQV